MTANGRKTGTEHRTATERRIELAAPPTTGDACCENGKIRAPVEASVPNRTIENDACKSTYSPYPLSLHDEKGLQLPFVVGGYW